MGTIARILDVKERIDQECYFCGDKRAVPYVLTGAISVTGEIIEKDVPCCQACLKYHAYHDDPNTTVIFRCE